jgi:probable H4MPT-linked C1 transfer pathway protein
VIGWDIGGAHVKAALLREGRVAEVAQWACPLWQGIEHLQRVLRSACARWPQLGAADHAVTMTGEMTDLFEHREDGVQRIAAVLGSTLAPTRPDALHFFAGVAGAEAIGAEARWCRAAEVGAHWAGIASANWLATALHAAQRLDEGVLIDIGSTTTDLIAFRAGRVLGASRSDVERLASGELVYHGVVRTPLCALGPRVEWRGAELNVMNEFFATTADVYRLTGELDPAHDLHPSADGAPKDLPATRRRLARMIGLDARDASADDWLAFARTWRHRQLDELAGQLRRVAAAHGLSGAAVAVSAGCGDFLVADILARAGAPQRGLRYGRDIARIAEGAQPSSDAAARWAQVCAPAVAVATLLDTGRR